ncbi:MAG: hypothetical protein ACYSWP_19280 [Planctomycetota bacterium]|jgi:uncharacterized protein with PQ loop repeat
MESDLTSIAGFIPAVILPSATFIQLLKILRVKSAHGVSIATWLLFGFANLGLYIYMEKFFEIQAILSLLLTAVIDFVIIGVVAYRNRKDKTDIGC